MRATTGSTSTPAATVDEGNNWINIAWGPLSLSNPSTVTAPGTIATPLGNYGPATGSSVTNYIPSTATVQYAAAPSLDFYGSARKTNSAVDAGAVELVGGGGGATAVLNVTPTSLTFASTPVGGTTATQNLTLHNTGTAGATGIGVAVTAPFSRVTTGAFPAGAPNCGTTLAAGSNCTVKVAFTPTAVGPANGTATFTANVTVSGSPVTLTGTGVAAVVAATLTPTSHAFGNATRGCTTGLFGTCPGQLFTLTNTGNVTLTGITQGAISGTNAADFPVLRPTSTCGPGGGGQLLGQTTVAPGASCVITVQFAPPTGDTAGAKGPATLSVTDAAGTQTSTPLTGNAL